MSTFTILIHNSTESSNQCNEARKKIKGIQMGKEDKTTLIYKWHDGLHRKSHKKTRTNKLIQYHHKRQCQCTKTITMNMWKEIKNTILLTICSKENEIIKYESNKKCTESVCWKLQNVAEINQRRSKWMERYSALWMIQHRESNDKV